MAIPLAIQTAGFFSAIDGTLLRRGFMIQEGAGTNTKTVFLIAVIADLQISTDCLPPG